MFFILFIYNNNAPKHEIKIVDVVDKEVKNDDEYAVTVDEVEKSELPAENEPLETTEETTALVEEKDETNRTAQGQGRSGGRARRSAGAPHRPCLTHPRLQRRLRFV